MEEQMTLEEPKLNRELLAAKWEHIRIDAQKLKARVEEMQRFDPGAKGELDITDVLEAQMAVAAQHVQALYPEAAAMMQTVAAGAKGVCTLARYA